MPSTFGVTLVSAGSSIVESVDVEYKAEVKVLKDTDGGFGAAQATSREFSFSVRGKGSTSVTVGGATGAPSNVSGKVIITSVKNTASNEDWQGFEYSGSAYPDAS